jgi:hypothetical protein
MQNETIIAMEEQAFLARLLAKQKVSAVYRYLYL